MGSSLDAFAQKSGRMPQIAMYYQDWYEGWSTALVNRKFTTQATNRGVIPMITWEPWLADAGRLDQRRYRLRQIASGAHDRYLRRAAREARAFRGPLLVRFGHEMNGDWYTWGREVQGNSARDFVRAWRHVVKIFRAEGARNVRWVWSPNVWGYNGVASALPYFPGDRWVDWVALDGYNWGSTQSSGWRTVSQVFKTSYDSLARRTRRPMMIGETGSTDRGGDKAQWLRRGLLTELPLRMPRIRVVVYFDRAKEEDWRVNSSEATLRAFRAVAGAARYRANSLSLLERSGLVASLP